MTSILQSLSKTVHLALGIAIILLIGLQIYQNQKAEVINLEDFLSTLKVEDVKRVKVMV